MNTKLTLHLLTVLILAALLFPFQVQTARGAPQSANIPPGHSDRILRLKFVEGTDTTDLQALLPAEAWAIIQKIDPLFTLPKDKLNELKDKGNEKLKKWKGDEAPSLPDLALWYEVRLVQGTDTEAALALFQALPVLEIVEPAPLMTEPPATGDYTSLQGYLDSATSGVDAEYAWTVAGGTGAGITIYDVEYGWILNHEDLSKAQNIPYLLNPGDSAVLSSQHHGTAVLGEMVADNNGFGVTGIAYGANIKLAPANTANLGWNVANAILLAANDGLPGDIILIEQQTPVCGLGLYGPSEYETAVFQAIQTATAQGLVVVEAAGNGNGSTGVNLDQSACGTTFNRSVRDSGAIIVGAGKPPASGLDRQREYAAASPQWGSSYGSRVDVQGWGTGVMTAGYGDYPDPDAWPLDEETYTDEFKGTSSASPMVAGAAAIVQSIAIQRNGAPLSPYQVRDLLVATGSPQQGNTAEHIGPRPDLLQAIANLPQSANTLIVNVGGSQNDGTCGVTDCSLSEAIVAANADSTHNFIVLDSYTTYTLTAVNNTDTSYGANGLPVITTPVTINGNGAVIERSSAAGTPEFRLFQVSSAGSLTLNRLTLRNGKLTGQNGGALLNLGEATVKDCTITGSNAANGGALANQGTLALVSSTLWSNTATNGSAIYNTGTLSGLGSTIAGGSTSGGANLTTSGTATLKNTLLLKGSSSGNCSGTLATESTTNMADDNSCGSRVTAKTTAQINLGALASNGGTTQTMALQAGSLAIDTGNATVCRASQVRSTDQRGYDRFADGNANGVRECDIGAYEYLSSQVLPDPPDPDTAPPQVRITLAPSLPDGLNGWYRTAPLVSASARDLSGVIEIRCALDAAVLPLAYTDLPEEACPFVGGAPGTDGVHTLYVGAMDLYGNQSAVISKAFQVDVTPPELTCPVAGPFLLHSDEHAIGPAGVDASVSGLDEAASTLTGIVTTGSVGPKPLTFTAFDLAGNSASLECSYNVIFDFGGFYPPVEPMPALNSAEAGSAVPLKFSLAGDQGLEILAAGFPATQQVACDTLLPVSDPTATKPAGKSGLSYDPLTGWYNYVWKTDKAWAGTCQALTIQLIDGTQHVAYFLFP